MDSNDGRLNEMNNNKITNNIKSEILNDRSIQAQSVFSNEAVVVNGDVLLVNDFSSALMYSETGSIASNDSGKNKTGISTPIRIKRTRSVDILKEKAVDILQSQLHKAHEELQLKDEKCQELADIRSKLESEIEELTASLFEEAHKMVREANEKRHLAEKREKEARGNIEALQAEVQALKSLVLTSTPSHPNPAMHPQLIKKKKEVPFNNKLKKTASCNSRSPTRENVIEMAQEVDPILMMEVSDWYDHVIKEDSSSTPENAMKLMKRIDAEDIQLCLTFFNEELSSRILPCVRDNSIAIEPIANHNHTDSCALSKLQCLCRYKINLGDTDEWHPISQTCRNRITAVCNFLTYVRYAEKGLIKHTKDQVYWEIIKHRREIALARLGYFLQE